MAPKRAVRWVGVAAACAAIAAAAGCGNSSTSDSASGTSAAAATGSTTSAASGGTNVAVMQKLVDEASKTAVIGPAAGAIAASDISAVTPADIKATPWKAGGPQKTVINISCASIDTQCQHKMALTDAIFKALGWKSSILVAGNDYSPASFQRAFNQAIAAKPDAIVTSGIRAQGLGPQFDAAKKAGIFTVGIDNSESGGLGYDAYVASGWSLSQSMIGALAIATTNGKGDVAWIDAPEFPQLMIPDGIQFLRNECPDCKVDTQKTTAAVAVNPVGLGSLVTSIIQSHPGLQVLGLPSTGVPISASAQAIARSSNPHVLQYGVGLNATAVESIRGKYIPLGIGPPSEWMALEAVDAVLRHDNGQPTIPTNEVKIGTMIMQPDAAPTAAKVTDYDVDQWAVSRFDFVKPYSDAWGVDLSSVIKPGS